MELFGWIKSIVGAFVFVIAMRTFIFSPILVEGASMMPTYEDGDRVIVNKIGKKISCIDRFDIIVFEAPIGENYIKRVIGLPGDHVAYKNDTLYINNEALEEPYLDLYKEQLIDTGTLTQDFTLEDLTDDATVPEGYLFVLGDNRRKSLDSRDPGVGFVPMEKVLGKVMMRYYPFDSFGIAK